MDSNNYSSTCARCGRAKSGDEQFINSKGMFLCPECASSVPTCPISIPNKFLTFMFSLVPGGGHMYLGLMQTGLLLMSIFFASIYLASQIDFFAIFIPVVYFYSFFSALNIRRSMSFGDKITDSDVWEIKFIKSNPKIVTGLFLGLAALSIISSFSWNLPKTMILAVVAIVILCFKKK